MSKQKGNMIYVWRIVFTYLICMFHFFVTFPIGRPTGWYISVEFFFFVSGYLLYKKYVSDPKTDAWQYTKARIKSIYPYYICALAVVFLLTAYLNQYSLKDMYDKLLDSVWEILLLQGIGLGRGWDYLIPILWYISVLVIAGYFIYYLLTKYHDNYVKFVVPLSVLLIYSYFYRNGAHLDRAMDIVLCTQEGMLRGIAGLNVGILCYRFRDYLENKMRTYWHLQLVAVVGFVFVISAAAGGSHTKMDFLYAILLALCVAIAFLPTKGKFWNGKPVVFLSGITLPIYVNHQIFYSHIYPYLFGEKVSGTREILLLMVSYLIVVTVYSAIFKICIDKVFGWIGAKIKSRKFF